MKKGWGTDLRCGRYSARVEGIRAAGRRGHCFRGGLGRKVRESDRLVIWEDIAAQDTQPPAHRHEMDAVAVAFTGQKPRIAFVPRGTVDHGEETAGADRSYFFELK